MSGIGNISALFVIFVIFVIFAVKKFVLRMFWVPVRDSAVHYTGNSTDEILPARSAGKKYSILCAQSLHRDCNRPVQVRQQQSRGATCGIPEVAAAVCHFGAFVL